MKNLRYLVVSALFLLVLTNCKRAEQNAENTVQYEWIESSVARYHKALLEGTITSRQMVENYLDRIQQYDKDSSGTQFNSVISLNPKALEEAVEKDKHLKSLDLEKYPLYGVPVLVKDNINTKDMPTSAGAKAFAGNRPTEDAFVVQQLKKAGAIILGKANLSEFAFDYSGNSSLGGLTKNAYDKTKGAGGSSSGTATAVSANFSMLGLGTDTGGSIRIPAALAGLVGLRPSMNLVSQNGVVPLSPWQDTVGPMCRKVEDCAIFLEVLIGYDPYIKGNQKIEYAIDARRINNASEYQKTVNPPSSYTDLLDSTGLKGMRIGVVRELFGTDSIAENYINPVLETALDQMKEAGAIVEEVEIADLDELLKRYSSMSSYEFKYYLEEYLNSWSVLEDQHILTLEELLASEGYLPSSKNSLKLRDSINLNRLTDQQRKIYQQNTEERPEYVRSRLLAAFADAEEPYDVLFYPTSSGLAADLGKGVRAGMSNRLSPFSGFPALSMPAGEVEVDGVFMPVGMEFLAREFEEATLLKIAYSYEVQFQPRKAPKID